jgi:hypothetical protein
MAIKSSADFKAKEARHFLVSQRGHAVRHRTPKLKLLGEVKLSHTPGLEAVVAALTATLQVDSRDSEKVAVANWTIGHLLELMFSSE